MKLLRRFKQVSSVIRGYIYKFYYDIFGFKGLKHLDDRGVNSKIVVSLTTYGRRVQKVVPYTLISLLNQSLKPDRIILWLDDVNWNPSNLPEKLIELTKFGIEIKFCKDIRSYKKLIPTLTLCPEDIIITVDDDAIYRKDLIKDLYLAHQKLPSAIICNIARFPELQNDGNMKPYESWFTEKTNPKFVMPLGVSGVLYPPKSLHPYVAREDLFMKLCPFADDIWFWVMGIINHTKYVVINQNRSIGSSFDWLYQILHMDAALTAQNRIAGKNDMQLKAVQEYFNLQFADFESNSNIITSTLTHKL